MAFDAHDRQVGEILNRAVFDIPTNQRRYVWGRNNWKELLVLKINFLILFDAAN